MEAPSSLRASALGRMGATAHAGRAGDLLGRLRMLETYAITPLQALAADARISPVELTSITLPMLDSVGGLQVERSNDQIISVRPLAIDQDDVMSIIFRLWQAFTPEAAEQTCLRLLHSVSRLPRTKQELFDFCTSEGFDERSCSEGLELAESVGLVKRRHVAEIGVDLYYNEFVWGDNIARTADALARLPSSVKEGLVSLLDELHRNEGRPVAAIQSASPELVRFAAENGIVEQTEIVTTDGRRAGFSFTPRLRGYGISKEDVVDDLDQIRLVIASFAFAQHHAVNRLNDPVAFLDKLVSAGTAGSAQPIATDYGALEKQQVVQVEPIFRGARNHRFVAVKHDALVAARDTMIAGELVGGAPVGGGEGLLDSRTFRDPIDTRLRLGREPGKAPLHQETLLAAVRDAAQGARPRPGRQ